MFWIGYVLHVVTSRVRFLDQQSFQLSNLPAVKVVLVLPAPVKGERG